jgi:hypothetical protein
LVGVVPVFKRGYKLVFDLYSKPLGGVAFRVAEILGGVPIAPADHRLYSVLFTRIVEAWDDCDGIYFDVLPEHSHCARSARDSNALPGICWN